jgi:serine/threonine protein kinase
MNVNIKYHNLDLVIQNLDIFKKQYMIINSIKINQKRGVYVVEDINDKKIKVLKFILKSNINKIQTKIFDFFMECKHKNFCKINELLNVDMFIVLVMDYINGDLLNMYFQKSHTCTEYIKIIFDLILALEYLHDNNIVHGDIKPDNIIVTTEGYPIIIDYDLSRYIEEENVYTKQIFGTKIFMSPELVIHNKFGTKSDIWSLGITLYVCIMKFGYDTCDMKTELLTDITQSKKIEKINYINKNIELIHETIAINYDKLKETYGKLFINIMSIMIIENCESRPSSKRLSDIIKKSKFYSQLHSDTSDNNVKIFSQIPNIIISNKTENKSASNILLQSC